MRWDTWVMLACSWLAGIYVMVHNQWWFVGLMLLGCSSAIAAFTTFANNNRHLL